MVTRRLGSVAGIAAPVAFVSAWVAGGLQAKGYSPTRDAISQLARMGAPTRPLMTAGFLGFSALAPFWAKTLGTSLNEPRVRASITAAAVTTLGVAALPLGASFGDGPHATAAGLAYVAMGTTPLWGGLALQRDGHNAAAYASYATTAASAALLVASLLGKYDGLFQRAGLGAPDAWFVAMAIRELRRS